MAPYSPRPLIQASDVTDCGILGGKINIQISDFLSGPNSIKLTIPIEAGQHSMEVALALFPQPFQGSNLDPPELSVGLKSAESENYLSCI